MKEYPLAIIAPTLGTRSETFIFKHMTGLLTDKTVVVARTKDTFIKDFNIQFPHLVLSDLKRDWRWLYQATCFALRLCKLSPIQNTVANYFEEHGVKVVLSEYLNYSLKWIAIKKELGIRVFAHAHGYDISKYLQDPVMRQRYLELNKADGIITMSEYSRIKLINIGLDQDKIHVIPYGISVPDSSATRNKRTVTRCLAVGRMVAKKSPLLTLKAFRRVLKFYPDTQLDYVGDGDLLSEAENYIAAHQLNANIILHGSQPNSTVQDLMSKADIFIQHSRTDPVTGDEEGLPVAILEAMAQSLPVVSTRHAGIPEAVIDGQTGYLANEGDVKGMADYICILVNNIDLRNRFGEKGWERVKNHFTWELEKSSLLKLFRLEN